MGQVSVQGDVGGSDASNDYNNLDHEEDMVCPGRNVEKPKRVERMLELPASGFTIHANMGSQVDNMDEEVF